MSVSYRLGFKIVISVLEWGRVKRFGWRKIRRRVQVIVASNGTIPGTNYISAGSYLQVIFLLLRFTTVACHEYPIVIAMVHSYSPIPSSVKQGWVQQIYKYLLDFYPCSSSSCTYVWSAWSLRESAARTMVFPARSLLTTTLLLVLKGQSQGAKRSIVGMDKC